ncbi:MAG TPA: PilC/PilY family type IV pilus protein [Nitrospiraceae bacterium]|nr:PilC/PilY family type IV pilus protein [Nitrospiraceae bacterium]
MKQILGGLLLAGILLVSGQHAAALVGPPMSAYQAYPPFINQSVPPLVMIAMSKDHRMFITAYNDIMDLNGDGTVETTYTDIINYYGYFDSNKCYTYSTANSRFEPSAAATGANLHYCSNQWSGNFLNWATMVRIDVVRKVLYGGARSTDTSGASGQTVLRRTWLPQDAHSFAKVYSGADLASLVPTNSASPAFTITSGSITLCNTNTAGISSQPGGRIKVVDGNFPYAASTESSAGGIIGQCTRTQTNSTTAITVKATLNADVLVCVPGMLETNCDTYQDNVTPTPNTWYKPTGLMQRMGVNRQGTYNNAADDTIQMTFGLISGSYGAHVGGGVVRSNIVDMSSEIDPSTGIVKATSQIINNINNFKIVQYSFSGGWYYGTDTATSNQANNNCNQGEPLVLQDTTGYCKSWGNPMGEMMYETIRFFKGLSGATPQFQVATPDSGVSGLSVVSAWTDPYASCPYCAKPFVLLFSDASPSYDSDHLPGYYSSWAAPTDPISNSDTPSVTTLVGNANMNTLEGIGNVFIGQSGTTFDRACTPKTGDFTQIRGLCTEEPTKQGAFYIAGLANYANVTDLRGALGNDTSNSVKQSLTTYSVVTNSPFPTLTFTVGANTVQVVPDFMDGCPKVNWGSPGYAGCTAVGTNGDSSKGEIVYFKLCPNDADWTTEQGNGFTSCYEIEWDDAEFGWDYDLDVLYRIYVQTNAGAGTITLKTKGLYAGAGHTDYAGYFINGVTNSGSYLDVVCGGVASFADCDVYTAITGAADGMGNSVNQRTFTVSGTTTQILKDPLWYAAKYGGFIDKNGNNIPDLQNEWDVNGDGVPDNYFYAVSPLYLEQQLANAFAAILNRSSSGTAASVLASSTTGDGALYQAFFFPSQIEGTRQVTWTGYTQGLFVDSFGNLREDTVNDGKLIYSQDNIIVTRYDPASGQVLVDKYQDLNGDGVADTTQPYITVTLTEIKPIWEAGNVLAQTAPASRNILTWVDLNGNGVVDASEFIPFTTANAAPLSAYLRADAVAPYTASNIISFVQGNYINGLRDRRLTVNGTLQVWKYGDPIYSTPVVVGAPAERYDILYGDPGYLNFYVKYRQRRQVAYVGANDGMLHAFDVGFYTPSDGTHHGCFTMNSTDNCSTQTTVSLGDEKWAFIPQELLPQLRFLADPGYTHVYYVDLKPKITDARIFTEEPACASGVTTVGCVHPGGWGTILIGGFRMGGSCGNCTTQGTPMSYAGDFDNNAGTPNTTRTFYSAYFVLDITNPEANPTLLWSFSDPNLGFTTSSPTVARVNPSTDPTTLATNEKWVALFGSGPTDYTAAAGQSSQIWAVDLKTGTTVTAPTVYPTGSWNAFMSDLITVDYNLDFRVDVLYAGRTINDGSGTWRGKLYRLTTNCLDTTQPCPTNPAQWGITSGSNQIPTEIIDTFTDASSTTRNLGPVVYAPVAVVDDSYKLWVFAGTGRYFSTADKTDTSSQYLVGIKDSVMTFSCTQTSSTSCWDNNLVDLTGITVCVAGVGTCTTANQVSGVTGVSTYPSLIALVQSKDGFVRILPTGERLSAGPSVFGGLAFYPTFVPNTDICVAGGNGYFYALYYKTGGPYSEPVIGTNAAGLNQNIADKSGGTQGVGTGAALQVIHNTPGGNPLIKECSQASTGALNCGKVNTAGAIASRYVSWINQRY